ncbi:hypothetical protein MRX96_022888 [Rhipicephalus microplus]
MKRASVFARLTHKEAEPEPGVKAPPEHASTTDEKNDASSSDQDPFARFPDNTNPQTGEVGGPTGPGANSVWRLGAKRKSVGLLAHCTVKRETYKIARYAVKLKPPVSVSM